MEGGSMTVTPSIKCQHCGEPIPLKVGVRTGYETEFWCAACGRRTTVRLTDRRP